MHLQKGHHFYALQISSGEKVLTAGVREVSDGKGETYVNNKDWGTVKIELIVNFRKCKRGKTDC